MFKNDKEEADYYKMVVIILFAIFLTIGWRYTEVVKENNQLHIEASK
jgi:hypothetical protein